MSSSGSDSGITNFAQGAPTSGEISGIDGAVVDTLREVGGEALIDQLFELFLEYTPVRLQGIRAAIASENAAELAYWSHSLRSGAASIGARDLSSRAGALESLAEPLTDADADTDSDTGQESLGAIASGISEHHADLLSCFEALEKNLRGYLVGRRQPQAQTAQTQSA